MSPVEAAPVLHSMYQCVCVFNAPAHSHTYVGTLMLVMLGQIDRAFISRTLSVECMSCSPDRRLQPSSVMQHDRPCALDRSVVPDQPVNQSLSKALVR